MDRTETDFGLIADIYLLPFFISVQTLSNVWETVTTWYAPG